MSLKKNAIANYAGQAWVVISSLAFVPIYIRELGIEAYGLIGLYTVLQTWFSLLDFGMTPAITRETAHFSAGNISNESIRSLIRSFEFITFSMAGIMAVSIWLLANPIASYWIDSQNLEINTVSNALKIIALVVSLRFCEGIYRGALYGLEKQVYYNIVYAVISTFRYAGAAILVSVYPSIFGFFIWQAVFSLVTILVLGITVYFLLPKSRKTYGFSIDAVNRIKGFVGGMSLTALFALIFTQLDKVFLTRMVDLESFGYYMLAMGLAGIYPMLASPAASAFFPRFSASVISNDTESEKKLFRTGVQVVALILVPVFTVFFILGNQVIFAWTGDAVLASNAGPILRYLSVGAFCNAFLQIPFMIQLAHGWTTLSVRVNLLGIIMLLPLLYFGINGYGLVGASVAWAVTNITLLVISTIVMHKNILISEMYRFSSNYLLIPLLTAGLVVFGVSGSFAMTSVEQLPHVLYVICNFLAALLTVLISLPLTNTLIKRMAMKFSEIIRSMRNT